LSTCPPRRIDDCQQPRGVLCRLPPACPRQVQSAFRNSQSNDSPNNPNWVCLARGVFICRLPGREVRPRTTRTWPHRGQGGRPQVRPRTSRQCRAACASRVRSNPDCQRAMSGDPSRPRPLLFIAQCECRLSTWLGWAPRLVGTPRRPPLLFAVTWTFTTCLRQAGSVLDIRHDGQVRYSPFLVVPGHRLPCRPALSSEVSTKVEAPPRRATTALPVAVQSAIRNPQSNDCTRWRPRLRARHERF